jgi:hypothetical protein
VGLDAINPTANALDSLGRIAWELEAADRENPLAVKGPVAWGFHAASLFFYIRLQPHKGSFDQWVQDYFHGWTAAIDVRKDSRLEHREHLGLLEIIDLLSEVEAESLRLEFYQGWTDKMARCRELRDKVQKLLGTVVSESERMDLLFLLALHNRLTHMPSQTAVETQTAFLKFESLLNLLEKLVDPEWLEAEAMLQALKRCRISLSALNLGAGS